MVIVSNKELDSYGAIGKIIDINESYLYPYEIKFAREYSENLFCYSDISIYEFEENKFEEKDDYIDIKFQDGTVNENGVNGCQIEDVITVLVERLKGFQNGNHPCMENEIAIIKLEEAKIWLEERTRRRVEQNVEGKYKNHE